MDSSRGPASFILVVVLGVQAAGAAAYLWLQPRGFSFGSRGFLEHQVVVPAFFAVAVTSLWAVRRQTPLALLGTGILAGFWIAVSGTVWVAGTTIFSKAMIVPLAGAGLASLFRPPLWGVALGLLLGSAFWACAWAPPATTRPSGGALEERRPVDGPPTLQEGELSVNVEGLRAIVQSKTRRADVRLAPDLFAISDRGLWSLFDFRSASPPAWRVERVEGETLDLRTACDDFATHARIGISEGRVRMRVATTFKREIAAHLATVLWVSIPSRKHREEVSEFIAFREGRMELLRSTDQEKGPFQTLEAWEPHDPVLEVNGWKVQVLGWADQASRAESPTAGWGVSQGAIDRVGDSLYYELAATSIGRGWHTVRTAPGTYLLEVVLTPPR